MTMIIEDGVGRQDANSFVDLDFARSYSADRHRAALLALTDEQLKAALIQGTDYTELRWASSYVGLRKKSSQSLSWPREYAYDESGSLIKGVPDPLKIAVVKLAERSVAVDSLIPDPPSPYPSKNQDGVSSEVTSGQITQITNKVGDLEVSKTFSDLSSPGSRTITSTLIGGVSAQEFPEVLLLVRQLIRGGSGTQTFVRY